MGATSGDGNVVGVVWRSSPDGGEPVVGVDLNLPAGAPRPAYTQTYSAASRTVPAATSVAVAATAATMVTPAGYASTAQANAIVTAINALRVDLDALTQVVNSLIDDSQALGLAL